MEPTTNIPYKKSDYYDEKGNLLDKNKRPFPYIHNDNSNRKRRRGTENPDRGRGWLYVFPNGKYKVRIQYIREIIDRRVVRTHSDKGHRVKTLYGKLLNIIRHADVEGNIQK